MRYVDYAREEVASVLQCIQTLFQFHFKPVEDKTFATQAKMRKAEEKLGFAATRQ
jgi:AraC-like DNA-binding protein